MVLKKKQRGDNFFTQIQNSQLEMDFVDCRHMTALFHASTGGHLGCVRQLLSKNADVTVPTATGVTALQEASSRRPNSRSL